ncbi:plastocyanin/azurin family copper-binding protein [Dokdonella sp.]|uniref:cupredoxin domain-containing protein n=1 Tax=Dokdonella sp. TaxID=2291710 RepID=UPI002604D966|nr:plastocyanin/azurin family copper-binding protein [Dokdonella sp.]
MHRHSAPAVGVFMLAAFPVFAADHVVTALPNFTFDPPALTIAAGDTVTFRNGGGRHNVASDPDAVTAFHCSDACGDNPTGAPSSASWSSTVTFPDVGVARYYCELHGGPGGSGMSGVINVALADPVFVDGFDG